MKTGFWYWWTSRIERWKRNRRKAKRRTPEIVTALDIKKAGGFGGFDAPSSWRGKDRR